MYKRLDRYKEKMVNMKPAVQDIPNSIMWIRGWSDGKNGCIDTKNNCLTSDYIFRSLRKHQKYSADIEQLAEEGLESVRYEIARLECELRSIKKKLRNALHTYQDLEQMTEKKPRQITAQREYIALLQGLKKDTECRLLEIQEELRSAEQTADELISASRKILEKKFQAYMSGAGRYLKSNAIWQNTAGKYLKDSTIWQNTAGRYLKDSSIWQSAA